jgi:hypothetical protein
MYGPSEIIGTLTGMGRQNRRVVSLCFAPVNELSQ